MGDRNRKSVLVEYGFRLPSALDNRPLTFEEFYDLSPQTIYVSATPAKYELAESEGVIAEQVIRPTGLLDPVVLVRPAMTQVDDLLDEIGDTVAKGERVLVTTITKRMAEELTRYLGNVGIKAKYIHSDVDTLERIETLRDLRLGVFDVLVGVNLLREGLDLPEVSLVAILDADKEGFLRSDSAMIQTIGRAARNVNSRAILYGDKITGSMQRAIDETNRHREKQIRYNQEHNIVPRQIIKTTEAILGQTSVIDMAAEMGAEYNVTKKQETKADNNVKEVSEPVLTYKTKEEMKKALKAAKRNMQKAAKELDYVNAAKYRDEITKLQDILGMS